MHHCGLFRDNRTQYLCIDSVQGCFCIGRRITNGTQTSTMKEFTYVDVFPQRRLVAAVRLVHSPVAYVLFHRRDNPY